MIQNKTSFIINAAILLLALFTSNLIQAKKIKENIIPQEFIYYGNPISPHCISDIYRKEGSKVSLNSCKETKDNYNNTSTSVPILLDDGFIGYKVTDPEKQYMEKGLDKYKYLGMYKNYH